MENSRQTVSQPAIEAVNFDVTVRTRDATLVLFLVLTLGCGGSGNSGEVDEIIDVEVPVEVDTSNDPQEVKRAPQLVGILPADFPQDVPLYLPASLIDFGTTATGRTVTLLTPHELSRVRPAYESLLRGAGWGVKRQNRDLELSKGERLLRLRFADGNPGSTYLVEY